MKLKALLAILLVVGLLLIPCPPTVEAQSWLDDYSYRKLIPINGSAGAGTDYKVPLTVYKDTKEVTVSQIAQSNTDALYSGARIRAGQRLTISSRNIVSLQFYISKLGSPTGDVWFRIRAVDDDEVLNEKLWGDASALQATKTWEEATFDTPVFVNEEVRFCCEYSGGDSSNYLAIQYQNPGVVANENYCVYAVAWFDYDTPPVADYDCAYKYTYYNEAGVVFLQGYCTDFPNDIRFTDDDGSTELDHDILGSDADLAKFLIEVADDLGSNQDIYIYWGKSGAGSGTSEFKEDFTGYTEYEEIGDPISVAATKIDANLSRNEEAWVVYDKTADYFGNFEHYLKVTPQSATGNTALVVIWVLSNAIDNTFALDIATEDHIHIRFLQDGSARRVITMLENNNGTWYTDQWNGDFTYTSAYYLDIKKVGTAFTCVIYSDATFETVVDTLTLTLKSDYSFQYIFGCNTHDSGHTPRMDIDIENLFLRTIITTEPVVGTPGALETKPVGEEITYIYIIG